MSEMLKNSPTTVRAYLTQGLVYWSESKSAFILIDEMNPTHAGNAAEKIVRQSALWLASSGTEGPMWPSLWVVQTPLVYALMARADSSKAE